jgi:hypothetical protein
VLSRIKYDHLPRSHKGNYEEKDRLTRFLALIRQAGGDPTTTRELEVFVRKHLDIKARAKELEVLYGALDREIGGLYRELEQHNADFEALQKLEEPGHMFSEEELGELRPLLSLYGTEVEKRLPPDKVDADYTIERMLYWKGRLGQAPFGSVRRFVAERAYARYGIIYEELNERSGPGAAVGAKARNYGD